MIEFRRKRRYSLETGKINFAIRGMIAQRRDWCNGNTSVFQTDAGSSILPSRTEYQFERSSSA